MAGQEKEQIDNKSTLMACLCTPCPAVLCLWSNAEKTEQCLLLNLKGLGWDLASSAGICVCVYVCLCDTINSVCV